MAKKFVVVANMADGRALYYCGAAVLTADRSKADQYSEFSADDMAHYLNEKVEKGLNHYHEGKAVFFHSSEVKPKPRRRSQSVLREIARDHGMTAVRGVVSGRIYYE